MFEIARIIWVFIIDVDGIDVAESKFFSIFGRTFTDVEASQHIRIRRGDCLHSIVIGLRIHVLSPFSIWTLLDYVTWLLAMHISPMYLCIHLKMGRCESGMLPLINVVCPPIPLLQVPKSLNAHLIAPMLLPPDATMS